MEEIQSVLRSVAKVPVTQSFAWLQGLKKKRHDTTMDDPWALQSRGGVALARLGASAAFTPDLSFV